MLHNQPESSHELLRRNNRELVDVMGGHTDTPVPVPAKVRSYRVRRATHTGQVTNMQTNDTRLKLAQAIDPAAVKLAGVPFASLFRGAAKAAPAAAPGLAKTIAPAAVKAPLAAAGLTKAVTPSVVKAPPARRPTVMHPLEQRVPPARPPVPPDVLTKYPGTTPQAYHMSSLSREFDARSAAAQAARQAPPTPPYVPDMGIRAVDPARLQLPKPAPRQKGAGLPLGRNFATKMLVGGPLAGGLGIGSYGLGRAMFGEKPGAYGRELNSSVDAAQADAARAYKAQISDSLDLADQRRTAVADASRRPAPLAGANQSTRGVLMPAPVRPIAAPVSPRRVPIGTGPRLGTAAPEMPAMYTPTPPASDPPVLTPPRAAAGPRLDAPDVAATAAQRAAATTGRPPALVPPTATSGPTLGRTGDGVADVTTPAQVAATGAAAGAGARSRGASIGAGGAIVGRAAGRSTSGDQGGTLSSLLSNLSPGMQNGLMVGGAGLGLVGLYKLLSAARAQRSREDEEPQAAPQQSGYGMMPMGYPGYGMPPHQPRTIILQ